MKSPPGLSHSSRRRRRLFHTRLRLERTVSYRLGMEPEEAVKALPRLLEQGRFLEARPLAEDLLAESVVLGWTEGLAEIEGICLRVVDEALRPGVRVPYPPLAVQAALLAGVEPQSLVGEGLLYAT